MLGIVVDLFHGCPFNHFASYPYLIPLGAGAILVSLLANGRIATVYSAFASLLFGAVNHWDPHLMLWAMLVQCAGVYAIATYRERAALLRAGLVVGGAGAASVLLLGTTSRGVRSSATASPCFAVTTISYEPGGSCPVGIRPNQESRSPESAGGSSGDAFANTSPFPLSWTASFTGPSRLVG